MCCVRIAIVSLAVLVFSLLSGITGIVYSQGWHSTVIDAVYDGDFWTATSIELDNNDFPHIAYYEGFTDTGYLKYAYWDGSSWQVSYITDSGDIGGCPSLELDNSGYAHISCYDIDNDEILYVVWDGTSWQISSVDTASWEYLYWFGHRTSLVLDSSGLPHISYYDGLPNEDLKYAHYDGANWQISTVDTEYNVGKWNSLSLDTSGNPHISYCDDTHYYLKYAYYDQSEWHITTVDPEYPSGAYTSIALDSLDYPHISYYIGSPVFKLKYAYYDGSEWVIEMIIIDGDSYSAGSNTSIAIDSSDNPHISCRSMHDSQLRYCYHDGTTWQFTTVDPENINYAIYTSITLDSNEYPHISFTDHDDPTYPRYLKYAWYEGPFPGISLEHFSAQVEGSAISLRWSVQTTEGEQILGFNLYRRELSAEQSSLGDIAHHGIKDDWIKINPTLITGENPYAYTDSSIKSGVAYEYKLEAVLADDSPETLGTTQATAGQPTSFAILALYPNPASDYLTCLLALPSAGVVELSLYDLSGRLVLEKRLEATEPTELEAILDVSGLASGVYTLRASSGVAEVSSLTVIAR